MRVLRGYLDVDPGTDRPAVTIGNFDGVHRGHGAVMRAAVEAARGRGAESLACTFDPHTLEVLRPDAAPPRLQTLEQRLAAIAEAGIDVAVVIPFDRAVAATTPEAFVDLFLLGRLRVGSLHLSSGFQFGRDHAGNRAYLERRARDCGFSVERVPPLLVDGSPVSSTRIRTLLARGSVVEAAHLLGRPYALAGSVVEGAGRGRSLDARTANLAVDGGCVPGHGVYLTEIRGAANELAPAVTNVGVRPTFENDPVTVVESHLLDYDGPSLYGRELEVQFLERIRDERSFDSAEDLRAQIARDIDRARAFFRLRTGAHGRV